MKGLGNPSRHVEALDGGEGVLEVFNVSEIWLNDPNRPNADPDEEDDTRFFFERPNGGKDLSRHVISQYLKKCHDILVKSRPSSDVLILSRTKRLPKGVSLTDFSDKLRSCLPANLRAQFNDRVNVMTAHASKGRQANIVIILRAVTGSFPLIHPDGELFRIFGTTAADELLV